MVDPPGGRAAVHGLLDGPHADDGQGPLPGRLDAGDGAAVAEQGDAAGLAAAPARSLEARAPARSRSAARGLPPSVTRARSPSSPALSSAVAHHRRAVCAAPAPAEPAQHPGGQRDEDGEDDPHAEPAGEEEPHGQHPALRPRSGPASSSASAASRTIILPVLPPRRRSRKAGDGVVEPLAHGLPDDELAGGHQRGHLLDELVPHVGVVADDEPAQAQLAWPRSGTCCAARAARSAAL